MRRCVAGAWPVALVLVMGACSSGSDDSADSSMVATTVAAASAEPTVASDAGLDVEVTSELAYLAYPDAPDVWNDHVLDVYAPTSAGPNPVIVLYHPDANSNTKQAMSGLATELAEAGAVVFTPTYGVRGREVDALQYYSGEGPACSYWYAHQHAAEYGGDPDDITLAGFSGGTLPAAAVAFHPATEAHRCLAEPTEANPTRLVLFEGDYTMAPHWDQALTEHPDIYDEFTVWRYIDDYAGPPVHLLADQQTRTPVRFRISGEEMVDSYLALRDPDGELRDALDAIGALDDGDLDYTESTMLFHQRLLDAGHETSMTWLDDAPHQLGPAARAAMINLALNGTNAP